MILHQTSLGILFFFFFFFVVIILVPLLVISCFPFYSWVADAISSIFFEFPIGEEDVQTSLRGQNGLTETFEFCRRRVRRYGMFDVESMRRGRIPDDDGSHR